MDYGVDLARYHVGRLWTRGFLLRTKANICYIRGRGLSRQQFDAMGG